MAVHHDLGAAGEQIDGFVDGLGPQQRIADFRAPQRQEVVHGLIADFRHAQHARIGQEESKLRWRFGAGGDLKLECDAVYGSDFPGLFDRVAGGDETSCSLGRVFANAAVHEAGRAGFDV